MISITKELLKELSSQDQKPCISVYMPAHRSHPENLQDVTHYSKLLKQLEVSLLQYYPLSELKLYMEPLEHLINDKSFWNHTTRGIAIFSAPGTFKVIGLQQSVEELAIVADSFHIKPLQQYLQTADRYQVLGLSLDRIQLFEGNRYSMVEIKLPEEMPATLTQVLGKDVTEKHSTVASYGGVGKGSIDMHHGDGGIKDQIDDDTEKFFRFISKEIFENYSKPSGLPLILAALPEHHSLFQKVSKNPFLLKDGIFKNPQYISTDNLAKMAWEILAPIYRLKITNLAEQFGQAKADNMGTDDLESVSAATASGRVATLIIEGERVIPGKITDGITGAIEKGIIGNPGTNDLLDDIAGIATKMGSEIIVIPAEDMPTQTGVAAIYRY